MRIDVHCKTLSICYAIEAVHLDLMKWQQKEDAIGIIHQKGRKEGWAALIYVKFVIVDLNPELI